MLTSPVQESIYYRCRLCKTLLISSTFPSEVTFNNHGQFPRFNANRSPYLNRDAFRNQREGYSLCKIKLGGTLPAMCCSGVQYTSAFLQKGKDVMICPLVTSSIRFPSLMAGYICMLPCCQCRVDCCCDGLDALQCRWRLDRIWFET